MALTKEMTASIITKFGTNDKDAGNTKVQIALLTQRIRDLTEHCKKFKKDKGSTRSLLKMVGHRGRMLKYLKRTDLEGYRGLIKELELRK